MLGGGRDPGGLLRGDEVRAQVGDRFGFML